MKFRVTFEIDEEVEADDREEAVEKAIGNVVGGQALVDGLGDFDDVREIEKKLKIAVKAFEDLKSMMFKESIIKQRWGVYRQMINRVDEALAKIKEIEG